MTRQSRSRCSAFGGSNTCDPRGDLRCPTAAGGMPPASLGKPNSPTVDRLARSLACYNTVGRARKQKPTDNLACKDHPPHRCSVSTCLATVYAPHHKRSSGCYCLTVQIRHYLHGIISRTAKSVSHSRFVLALG